MKRKMESEKWKVGFLLMAMLIMGGTAKAQLLIKGNVFGGGENATVTHDVTVNFHGRVVGDVPQDTIKGDVYGGGGFADVNTDNHDTTRVILNGGVVNGNIYGGGLGRLANNSVSPAISAVAAEVNGPVYVTVMDGKATNVFGCNNINGCPETIVQVTIQGGTVGNVYGGGNTAAYTPNNAQLLSPEVNVLHGTVTGNVYGSGLSAAVTSNPVVTVGDAVAAHDPAVQGNVYGGGQQGAVNGNTYVNVVKGTLGTDTKPNTDPEVDGMVFGGSEGLPGLGNHEVGMVRDTAFVTIGVQNGNNADIAIKGSVFGGGDDGQVKETQVVVHSGTIGKSLTVAEMVDNLTTPVVIYRGNVYGGGRGIDQYEDPSHLLHYDSEEGRVHGNTSVTINGGKIYHDVYGAGSLASVGSVTGNSYDAGTGKSTVTINGGEIGMSLDDAQAAGDRTLAGINSGQVFGSGRGIAGTDFMGFANVDSTVVTITGGQIYGLVFGGGANGHVKGSTVVNMTGGAIGIDEATAFGNNDQRWKIHRGNIYGGGRGIDHDDHDHISNTAGKVYGNTNINISGNAQVYQSVFGGGSIASVGEYSYDSEGNITGNVSGGTTNVTISGGTIGVDGNYNGHVFGAGRGEPGLAFANYTFVNNANITVSDSAQINGSVYGSGDNGHTYNDTHVDIEGGVVGSAWTMVGNGNVFGGGRGQDTDASGNISRTAGKVNGNTYVNVTGGLIKQMVYGGGDLAMVGEFNYDNEGNITSYISGGTANVSVTGGTIGDNVIAHDNGHVFGAGRGVPGGNYFKYNYVNHANVIIKDSINNNSIVSTPNIYGSVFGGGENGHVYDSTKVTINGGTIGTLLTWEHQTSPKDTIITEMAEGVHVNRGNVYGGGRGIEPDASHTYSYTAGWVRNKTKVIINGGKIYHNVFGGGSLASVGPLNNPQNGQGETYVIINGGEIGMNNEEATHTFQYQGQDTTINYSGINSGQVFGGGRGEVNEASSSTYTNLAYVQNTNVTVNPNTGHIYGAVFGGGANGHVAQNTKVYIKGGTIGHPVPEGDQEELAHDPTIIYYGNVYGGGRGVDHNSTGGLSSTAGKVFGNTEVEVTGGTIYHCVYGGGSLANVGEENDDNTGLAKVTVTGGRIGTTGKNNGSVFGGARGEAGGTFTTLAYVKNTQVVIGEKNGSNDNLTITGSVFGGGANGHVRKDTDVKLFSGTIGTPLTVEEMVEADPVSGTTRRHLFRGNVYGGGRGVDHDNSGHLSSSAGRVYGNTNVSILGGKVYHCIYGGGSLASVGTYTENSSGILEFEDGTGHADVTVKAGEIGMSPTDAAAVSGSDEWHAGLNSGQVYGSGRGETGSTYAKFAFTNTTHVTIDSVAKVFGAVFGGGANGHVEDSTYVEVKGGEIGIDDVSSNHFSNYRGNVYGGGRGIDLDNSGHVSASAGQVYGNARVKITKGNVYHNVFGGGSLASVGTYQVSGNDTICTNGGKATVIVKGGTIGVNHKHNGCVYGSGRGYPGTDHGTDFGHLTFVDNSYVYIDSVAYIKGDVFGSGDNGHVRSDAHVIMTGGTIGHDHGGFQNGNLFGGGRGVDTLSNGTLSITAGLVRGDVYVNISGGQVLHNVYGGGYMASVKGNTNIEISGNAQIGDRDGHKQGGMVFGGGRGIEKPYEEDGITHVVSTPAYARIEGNTNVTITGGTVDSTVYGGGRLGAVGGVANVTVNGGTLLYDVFGAGEGEVGNSPFKSDVKSGTVVNLIGSSYITGNVYGGGRNGTVGKPWKESSKGVATVQVNLGNSGNSYTGNDTINGSIFGGGMAAQVNGNTTVNINSGYIAENVYGGNQNNDTVKGNITVNVNKGTVNHDLFGGGLGQLTATAGNVTVNFGEEHYNSSEEIHVNYPILNGDLYGGSAYGTVNDAGSDKNTVNIINGNLNGDVYGGGLGDTITTPGDGHENIAALTYGQIEVNVGKAKSATDTVGMAVFATGKSVYGCNNINGTPKDNVFVNIYKTAHGADPAHNLYPSGIDWTQMGALANNTAVQTYAIRSVYGGGNKASYTPIAGKSTKVHVYTCVNTIEDVYGGGNAAHIGSSALNADAGLEIEGGRIKRIFGGGNGTVVEADIYGDATALVHGGVINEAFGGSNEQGIITGTTALEIDSTGCDVFIGSVFGGGNNAIIFGDGELTILCGAGNFDEVYGGSNMADIGDPTHPSNVTLNIQGGVINKVFGGSKGRLADPANSITEKSANIYGNVTLNLEGGRIGHAYGGSNINGNIHGIITVNVLDADSVACPLIVDTIFGASNATPYTPDSVLVHGVKSTPISPIVNVKHIRNGQSIQGCVFGGGNGTQAVVTANPKVTIGDSDNTGHFATIEENVYGGGNRAQVVGDTQVILDGSKSTVDIKGNVYGAGHGAEVDGNAKVEVK